MTLKYLMLEILGLNVVTSLNEVFEFSQDTQVIVYNKVSTYKHYKKIALSFVNYTEEEIEDILDTIEVEASYNDIDLYPNGAYIFELEYEQDKVDLNYIEYYKVELEVMKKNEKI